MSLRFILARATPGQGKVVKQVTHHVSRRTPAPSTNTFLKGSLSSVLPGQKVVTEHAKDNPCFWYRCGEQRRCQALGEMLFLCKLPVTAGNRT